MASSLTPTSSTSPSTNPNDSGVSSGSMERLPNLAVTSDSPSPTRLQSERRSTLMGVLILILVWISLPIQSLTSRKMSVPYFIRLTSSAWSCFWPRSAAAWSVRRRRHIAAACLDSRASQRACLAASSCSRRSSAASAALSLASSACLLPRSSSSRRASAACSLSRRSCSALAASAFVSRSAASWASKYASLRLTLITSPSRKWTCAGVSVGRSSAPLHVKMTSGKRRLNRLAT
mmetsp:Transcript_37038/g.105886  ORF Transcript_37038/g.105886 Transcript_37038/m.105886 type:complete len:234 (+) Transcript_37038:923-1624(+)